MMRRGFSYGATSSGGGGSGTPGGADTNVQINDAGAFYGDSGFTYDKTNRTINIGGGAVTTSDPVLDLTQTWNDGAVEFTGIKSNVTNTASAAGSMLLDLQVGGDSRFRVKAPGLSVERGGYGANSVVFNSLDNTTFSFAQNAGSVPWVTIVNSGFYFGSSYDTAFLRDDAANTLAMRNSTNAQTFRVYDTYTDASNYSRLALNAGAAGDWVQVAAESAGTGADNIGIALTPTGTGAISAQVPDSTTAGGNPRGVNSVDWQTLRFSATQVSSGDYSSTGGGRDNQANGLCSTISGGYQSTTANYATVGGGYINYAGGSASSIGGGFQNYTENAHSTIAGGRENRATGENSWIPGGIQADTWYLIGAGAYSSGQRAARGDAQVILQPVRQTTAATATVNLTTDAAAESASNCMVLPVNSGCQFEGRLTAVHAAGAAVGGWKVEGIARRGAAGAATVVDVVVTAFAHDAAIGVPVVTVIGTASGAIMFQITPANATTTYWVGRIELIQAA